MTETHLLRLPYIMAAQAQKHVTHNEALRALDAIVQLGVVDRNLAAPPTTPSEGERHIVAAAASGAWAGKSGQIAAFQDGAWAFYPPREGWLAWVADEDILVAWTGSAWVTAGGGGSGTINPALLIGVNTTANTTNRLAVKSDAVLLSHDDVTPGTGDMRIVANKSTAARTASFLFQTGFSGRAEIGLAGDDNVRVKISADGTTWLEALIIDRTTGRVSMPLTPRREILMGPRTYYVRVDGSDTNSGLADAAGGAFRTIQKALNVVYGTLDLGGFNVTIQVRAGTYAEALSITSPQVGAGNITLTGDVTTPANVTVSSAGTGLYVEGAGTKLFLAGIKVTATGFAGWHAASGGFIQTAGRNEIGAVGGHQIIAEGPSTIYMVNEMIITGGCAGWHLNAGNNGYIYTQGAAWTIVGTPVLAGFASVNSGGVIYTFANTFTGTISGQRYNASLNGVIQTNTGGNVNYWPGSVAGTTTTGGQYA